MMSAQWDCLELIMESLAGAYPQHFTLDAYTHVIFGTKIGLWYINSLTTSIAITR